MLHREGRFARQVRARDIALLAVATHKLTRIVTLDFITIPLRAPFTRYDGSAGAGEVREGQVDVEDLRLDATPRDGEVVTRRLGRTTDRGAMRSRPDEFRGRRGSIVCARRDCKAPARRFPMNTYEEQHLRSGRLDDDIRDDARGEGRMKSVERQGRRMPFGAFVWAAGAAVVGSLALEVFGLRRRRRRFGRLAPIQSETHAPLASFIGMWVPSLLLLGIYRKLTPHDDWERFSH